MAEPQKDPPRTSSHYQWGVRVRTKEEEKEEETELPLRKITAPM